MQARSKGIEAHRTTSHHITEACVSEPLATFKSSCTRNATYLVSSVCSTQAVTCLPTSPPQPPTHTGKPQLSIPAATLGIHDSNSSHIIVHYSTTLELLPWTLIYRPTTGVHTGDTLPRVPLLNVESFEPACHPSCLLYPDILPSCRGA